MWHKIKIRGIRAILTAAFLTVPIIMPPAFCSHPPEGKEWVVVIDAGHGGKDPGALGSQAREKNINLAVALKTGHYLSNNLQNVRVIYTRKDDTFLGLDERAEVANKNKADIFISIHSNSFPNNRRISGAETYVLGTSRNEENLQVVMKENSVITFEEDYQTKYEGYDPNSAESFIIFSLMQNTFLKQSTEFATLVQDQFRDRVGRRDRGVRQGGFLVLRKTTMPAVLVELGYVTNSEDEKFLLSEQGQDYMASAIFRAFRDYKQSIDSRSGISQVREATALPSPPATSAEDSVAARVKRALAVDDDGIWFTVQIASMPENRELDQNKLRGLEMVNKVEDQKLVKYTSGKFVIYDEALSYRRSLIERFPDAFVIAIRNGKVMPLREAIEAKKIK